MAATVVSFLRREPQSADWTRNELAELYRVEHALIQAGLALETDRGVSDEGDPWFVFCRPDGGVLIHLTRYDGLYRLYSPALPEPLSGPSFAALTKSFAEHIPIQVTVQRGRETRLFVHPAALLAVVVGTIMIASNELPLTPHSDHEKKAGDSWETAAGGSLKGLLQSTYQAYIDHFMSWLRDTSNLQQASAYLTTISAVAAFIVGTALSLSSDDTSHGVQISMHSDSSEATLAGDLDWMAPRDQNTHSDKLADAKVSAEPNTPDGNGADANANGQILHQLALADLTSDKDASHGADAARHDTAKSGDPSVTGAESALSEQKWAATPIPGDLNPHADLAAFIHAASVAMTNNGSSSPDPLKDLMSHLTAAIQSGAAAPLTGSLSIGSDISAILSQTFHRDGFDMGSATFQIADFHGPTIAAPTTLAVETASSHLPIWDNTAAATLLNFVVANHETLQWTSDDHYNLVVSDGLGSSTRTQTVSVWEFENGTTLTLIGHVDNVDHGTIA